MDKDKYQEKVMEKQKQRIGHIVSHTHWDREWRYPIWETRLMLIDFMDELIELLELNIYPGFLMDGQVSPVLDYLETRPEMTEKIRLLVSKGKLEIGPWLTLPDEYPIDGECFIRNLMYGISNCRKLGGVFEVGYTPFGWGQTAQLSQIYAGFGFDVVMVGKKVSKNRAPQCEFIWESPDGSQLLATRFGELGRQNFFLPTHLSALFGVDYLGLDWKYDWSKGGIAYHRADLEQMEQDHFQLEKPVKWYSEWITPQRAESAWATMDESVLTNDRLMMNGCDYSAPQKFMPEMVKRLNDIDALSDRHWIHTTMRSYVDLMRKNIDRSKLIIVNGELRDGPAGGTSGNALTTRLALKRLNKKAENLLIRFAEPLSTLMAMRGFSYPQKLIETAWMFILNSHPHDSINGVTQDKTAKDVENRLEQVIDIAQALINRAMQNLVKQIDTSDFSDSDVLLTIFNPSPNSRREVINAFVNLPDDSTAFDFWPASEDGLVVFDTASGKPVPTQWQGKTAQLYPVVELHTRAWPYKCLRHHIIFDTTEIPACGYKVFRIGSINELHDRKCVHSSSLVRSHTLRVSPHSLENEFLKVTVNPNGTFDLEAKELGRTFQSLGYFEDRGEHGDYWVNIPPTHDQIHTSLGCASHIWTREHGPLQATLVNEVVMRIPQRGIRTEQSQSESLVDFKVQTAITLKAGSKQVELEISFNNQCEDHFTRVMFPTGLTRASMVDAGGHFTVDSRPIQPQGPSEECIWPDMATLPHQRFVDISDNELGIAFLNDCLTEYEVLGPDRIMALSLLKSVRNWICTESRVGSVFPSQKGGQCIGDHNFHLAIRPHKGNWSAAEIPSFADSFNAPLLPVQTRRTHGTLPHTGVSFFNIDNSQIRLSALKKAQDRDTTILRLYNPTPLRQITNLTFCGQIKKAWYANLNEERQGEIELSCNNIIALSIEPYKIVTIEVQINNE